MLVFLLVAPSSQIDFAYAGKSVVDGSAFEVIEARGQKGFAAKLFFEPNTFRFLAKLTYRGQLQHPATSKRVQMNRQADGRSLIPADEESAKFAENGNKPAASQTAQNEEITLIIAEYEAVDGISLPHRITKSAAGAKEIWEFKTFRLNAAKAGGFE